jgi:hypothetical protein
LVWYVARLGQTMKVLVFWVPVLEGNFACDFVGIEATPVVIIPGEFLAERWSVVSNHKKSKRIPSIFNDESTESFMYLRRHIYMSYVLLLCISFLHVLVVLVRVTCICVT